jgi:hypothetical protein
METIWKYPLRIEDYQTVSVPVGAVPVAVQNQNEQIVMWCRVTIEPKYEPKLTNMEIRIAGTGHTIEGNHEYIGTVQTQNGRFAWHVFRVNTWAHVIVRQGASFFGA